MPGLVKPRPSLAHRWYEGGCHGSVQLEAQFPQTSNATSEEGQREHDLAAAVLKGEKKLEDLDKSDFESISVYVNAVRAVYAEAYERHRQTPGSHPPAMYVETEFALPDDGMVGHVDCAIFDYVAQTLWIDDYKSGWALVEAEGNPQLVGYSALLAPSRWSLKLRVIQPKPYHPDGPVRVWETDRYKIEAHIQWMWKAYKAALKPDAKLVPGAHCLYCDALSGCPAARDVSLRAVELSGREPEHLPAEHLARELEVLKEAQRMLELRAEALTQSIESKLRKGERVEGAMLAPRSYGRTKWNRPEAEVRSIIHQHTQRDLAVVKIPTPNQVRKMGIPDELVRSLSQHQPAAMKVSLHPEQEARRVFKDEASMEYVKQNE